jgi:asparagine synthetase B (glutamine-hydrolysing)
VEGFVVYHHPETPLRHQVGDGGSVVLIGHAFAVPADRTVEAVLNELVAAETDDLFLESLDALSGRFALLVLKKSAKRVFHDPVGSRSLFYRASGAFCVSSHAELIANVFGHQRNRAVRELMATDRYMTMNTKYLPGDLTVYEEVYALVPNNYYDVADGKTVRYWPRRDRRPTSFEEFFRELDDYFTALVSDLRDHRPIVGVTGGIDCRVLLAAFRCRGLEVRGVTWLDRATRERELPSVMEVAARASKEHTFLPFRRPTDEAPEIASAAMRNVGGFRTEGGTSLTVRMHQRYAGRGAVFIRGSAAEVIRGFYQYTVRRPMGTLAASELLRLYSRRFTEVRPERADDAAARRIGLAAFEGFMVRANYDERLVNSGFDLNDIFYWEHRMGMWSAAQHNELDPATPSLSGFNSRRVYEAAFGMNPQQRGWDPRRAYGTRLHKELLREVIRRYDPPMAEIPIF